MPVNEKVAIIGSGTMGHSIALSAAMAGLEIKIWGNSQEDLEKGQKGLEDKIQVLIRYEVIDSDEFETVRNSVYLQTLLRNVLRTQLLL